MSSLGSTGIKEKIIFPAVFDIPYDAEVFVLIGVFVMKSDDFFFVFEVFVEVIIFFQNFFFFVCHNMLLKRCVFAR